jgi:hypothetical protein
MGQCAQLSAWARGYGQEDAPPTRCSWSAWAGTFPIYRAYSLMMSVMPPWHTGQNLSLRSNMMHCMAGR